ncbi:MAG: YbaY family lipoprotein, partial [Acidobacteriota bacterium]|nr:YbaY family lipoprotein [Acidobacteriota bacterium]
DRPLRNWNTSSNVPAAPRATGDSPTNSFCRDNVRTPESIADRAVTRAGWSLFGAAQVYGSATLINGMASVDRMCRPTQYNTFVFVGNRFAGTLSPDVMNSRTDGALADANLSNATSITAEFLRYTSSDALCCPSQMSSVSYKIGAANVQAENVSTSINCKKEAEDPVDPNVVTGTVTYSTRTALPRNAILTVRLVDISNQNAPARLIAEQRIDLTGRVPVSFQLRFKEADIVFRNQYAVEAEISSGATVLYKNDVTSRVLTQGNPNYVEITVVPVVVSTPQNEGILRGLVNYTQRIILPADADVRVKLMDVSPPLIGSGVVIAEDNFRANGRQIPLSFELRFDRNQIRANRTYLVESEIYIGGKLAYKNERQYAVLTQGNPATNVEIMLAFASDEKVEPTVITGREINISKFGTGSFAIEGGSSEFLIRARVKVETDGKAEVTVSPIGTATTFSGNLTYADDGTLRITVTKSGNADASGEIEVKYSGRRLNSINSKDLVLDGQKATISF